MPAPRFFFFWYDRFHWLKFFFNNINVFEYLGIILFSYQSLFKTLNLNIEKAQSL